MRNIIRLEEVAMFGLTVFLNHQLPVADWWYWVFFLVPDIGMLGYLINTQVGAFTYNAFHHKGIALLVYIAGIFFTNYTLQFAGLVLFGHSSFDRALGYGLKYGDSFKNTHLGVIGR
jgi:hypothetical protein